MPTLHEAVRGRLVPDELREAYRHWIKAPRSRKRRDTVYFLALPLVGMVASRIRVRDMDSRDDLEQTLSIRLYETLFFYLPSKPTLTKDLVSGSNGELSSYLGNALRTSSQDWLDRFKRWRDETFDFNWACVRPPHASVGDPRSDVLPRLYREEARRWAFQYAREKNRLTGKLREAAALTIEYIERDLPVPDFQLRQRGLNSQQRKFVVDYVLVLEKMGLEELLTRELGESNASV